MKLKSLSLLFYLCCVIVSQAQTSTTSIQVLSKVTKESVWLRWAPTRPEVWQLGNQYGYAIERFTIKPDGSIDTNAAVKLTSESVKPLTKDEFNKLDESQNNIAAVGELIYTVEEPGKAKGGNSPAELLQKGGDMNNRFGMALLLCDFSYKTAQAAGLFYSDATATKGERYIYKIKLASEADKLKSTEPGVIVVDVKETPPLKAFTDLRANFKNKTVTLSWSTFTHKGVYGAYIIEKSSDGKTFSPINDLPYVSMSESNIAEEAHYVDSLAANGTTFSYRVKGITPFGEQGPPSNVVSGVGKEDMTGVIAISKIILDDKKVATLTWDFPVSYENKINGFRISKSSKADGRYTDMTKKPLSKKVRTYELGGLTSSAYFQVKAIDKEGKEVSASFPFFYHVEDNTPPAIPANLAGRISEKGIVSLSWLPNKEADIMGYRVFSSHNLKNEFVEVTTSILTTTQFTDSVDLKLLNKTIFYNVVAVDQNYNTSAYSKPLSLSIPDKVAPAAPVFSKAKITGNQVDLEWIPSTSNDVVEYTLTRIAKGDTTRQVIMGWEKGSFENTYSDSKIELGKTYQYQLSVYDSTKNTSKALSKELEFETGLRKAVSEFSATINRDNKTILLKWSYEAPIKKCILYRKKNDQPFSLYQSLDGTVKEFSDGLITINNTYSYKIQLELDNGIKTELSKELKVPF